MRAHRDVEEPVEEEDQHGRGVVEEYVVPGSSAIISSVRTSIVIMPIIVAIPKSPLEVSREVEIDGNAGLVLLGAAVVARDVLIIQQIKD